MIDEKSNGLYKKYDVKRVNDPEGKHEACPFFVLDLKHDPYARIALSVYIQSCESDYPQLADDLRKLINL